MTTAWCRSSVPTTRPTGSCGPSSSTATTPTGTITDKDLAREAEVGDVYSAEIDTSGTGRIYYVNFVYGSGVEPAGERVWDSEEYFAWLDSVLGRSQEVEIPYQHLTEQNIADTLGGQPPMQTVPPDGMPEG